MDEHQTPSPGTALELSNRILTEASGKIRRADLLLNTATSLLDLIKCDAVRMVIIDRDRRHRVRTDRYSGRSPHVEETPGINRHASVPIWTSGRNEVLEEMCRDMVENRADTTREWFTGNGSLVTDNITRLAVPDINQPVRPESMGIIVAEDDRSLLIVPVRQNETRVGLAEFSSKQCEFFDRERIRLIEGFVSSLGTALGQRRMRLDLRERVKELTCLYGIAKLAARAELPLERILDQAVELLPPGWLYPDIAAGRIAFDGVTYATAGIERAVASMTSDIVIDGTVRGEIEVAYTKEAPQLDEGPFLTEERNLIDTLARELSFIIQQRAYQEERIHLREQIRRSDRLAAIGQFAAGICHELNEPLTNILGFAQLVSKNTTMDEQARQDLGKIVAATLRAKDIVGKLSAFTGETRTVRTEVNINELISEGFEAIEARFSTTGIRLVCNLDSRIPPLNADRSQLLQALTNLVVNAVQAMPEGGILTIETKLDPGAGMVIIRVEDNGKGIAEDIRDDIFHPFFTTKDINGGAGLGLSVVHGIVTAHGGRIDLRSEVGEGSCFEIHLPVNRP